MRIRVVTYQSPNGERINLTRAQIRAIKPGEWPKDSRGAEYCAVSHGLHYGTPAN